MKNYVAELIGTFVLVFVGTGSVVVNNVTDGDVSLVGIAMAWGLVVAAMVYSFGDISGAHINPAVTIALWLGRKFEGRHVVPYIASQCVGAILASALMRVMFPGQDGWGSTMPDGVWWQSFIMEIMLTLILLMVVLNVGAGDKDNGIVAGLVIGGVISFEVLCGGPISGASMNPARSIGPALIGGQMDYLWIYLTAPVIGGAIAVPITAFLRPADGDQTSS